MNEVANSATSSDCSFVRLANETEPMLKQSARVMQEIAIFDLSLIYLHSPKRTALYQRKP
jgi:hypothetical protein